MRTFTNKRIVFLIFIQVFFACFNYVTAQYSTKGFKRTKSGLLYKVIQKGKGEPVKNSYRVYFNYITRIHSDTIFDSNGKNPYAFIVGEREGLKGWDEALVLARLGDSIHFIFPPHLAYGNRKLGKIKSNTTLFFEVRVLGQIEIYYSSNKPIDTLVLESGVKKVIHFKSNQKQVSAGSYVTLDFTGYIKTEEGCRRVFESTKIKSNPAVVQLGIGKFIKGLDAGISTMRIGEKATFIISSDKGYGNKKVGIVPANSTLYYDIELVSETNPFLTFPALDTILLNENMKLLIERNNGSEFQVDKVLECNLLTYYKNAEGINVILTDSKLTSTPVYVLYNSKLISSDLLLAMRYFKSKENGLIIMPLNKAVELKGQVQNSGAQYIYYQLSNIRILDYPFFPIIQSDTIYTEEKVKYQIVKKGNETGSSFTNNSVIKLAYTGYFMDNSKKVIFSTSRESGKPLEYNFNTETIIRGLVIGSREMKMGEARKVYIPYTLAYGEKGVPAAGIPPKTDLIFEIEAVNIIKQ